MRERLLARIGELCVDNPWVVIGVWALLGLGSALALPSIEIASSRFELIAGEDAFVDARGARTDLVVTVTAEDPASARAAADDLAERLRELPTTHAVLHRIDPRWWRGQEVLFVPTDELAALASGGPRADDLASMVEAARAGLATDSDETLDSLDPAPAAPEPARIALLVELLRDAERWQRDEARDTLGPDAGDRALPLDEAGYFVSRDGATRYLFVTPTEATDRYEYVAPLVRAARAEGAEVVAAHGARIAFTGYPALAVDEVEAIRGGSLVTGAVSAILVIALFAIGFRSLGGVVVAGAPLGIGMLCAFGMVALTVGELNLLTQAAAPVFAGLGIDFAVHLLAAYDLARRGGATQQGAIDGAMRGAGKAVVTGGLTTAGAFACLVVAEHAAFRELGIVASVGLLIVLAAILTLIPALLSLGQARGWTALMIGRGAARLGQAPAGPTGRLAAAVTRRPWLTVGLAAAVTIGLALGIPSLRFDPDVEALLPHDAESVRAARQVTEDGTFSDEVLVTHAADVEALHARVDALSALPSVGHVESAADFVPRDLAARLAILADAPAAARPPAPTDAPPLQRSLPALARLAATTADDVERLGASARAAELRELAAAARALADELDDARLDAFDAALSERLASLRAGIEAARDAPPDPLAALPEPLRRRLVADDGGYPIYVHPANDVFAPGELDRFVGETRAVAPDVAGSPVDFAAFLAGMQRSLAWAALLAAVVVIVLLGADFRRPREVLLAVSPLLFAVTWLFGVMGWLGIDANMANLAALPLVLGIGVDDGVHLIHRRRALPDVGRALSSVLRALVLTTATTVAAFGALGLAAHRGMQSFALVMVIGATGCLAATTLVLPALIALAWPQDSASK